MPCTNCTAFALSCSNATLPSRSETNDDFQHRFAARPDLLAFVNTAHSKEQLGTRNPMQMLEDYLMHEGDEGNLYLRFMDPELRKAPIMEPGRVAYVGESSNLPFLVDDPRIAGVVHYQLPENFSDARAKLSKMDGVEIKILRQNGALSLPPQGICDELVESYFHWVAPLLPVINKGQFMRQYRDPDNPPSLLLLQAVFLASSTVTVQASITSKELYRRAKALYDSGYENDRVIIIQALLLISWYWETCQGHLQDVMYWNGLAITVALGSGIHRSVERSSFSLDDKRLWRRLWWTLVTRDRSTVLQGQVAQIHTDDSDVEMVSENDFIDDECPPDAIHVRFFIQWVKLCIVVDAILHQGTQPLWTSGTTVAARCDGLLSRWLASRPRELRWEEPRCGVWATALLRKYEAAVSFLQG